jgi:hypothetical protein
MQDRIRLATPEEIETIEKQADLTPRSTVWAYGKSLAVTRLAPEIDPVFWGDGTPDIRKAWFIWGLENMLRGNGMSEFYFNVRVSDEKFIKIAEGFGAEKTSVEPEYRFKKTL